MKIFKNKIFISHSTKDGIGPLFVDYLVSIGVKRNSIFCSSNADTGIDATKGWYDTIFEEIRNSGTVILVATPNYMRSGISLLEAGAAIGSKAQLVILAFPNVDTAELKNMFGVHQIIDFSLPEHRLLFKKCIEDNLVRRQMEDADLFNSGYDALMSTLCEHRNADPDLPPISMRKENPSIIKPCKELGIERITLDQVDMTQRIRNARRIRILTTTGAGFFRKYNISDHGSNPLLYALKRGCEIEVLMGNPSGVLFHDVETMEERSRGSLNNEFSLVISELSSLVLKAEGEGCGTVRVGNVDASLRQTVILIYDEAVWGWTTVTLPPARCNAQSLSLELRDVGDGALIHKYENYFDAIWNKASANNEIWDLRDGAGECFRYEGELALAKWSEKQRAAKENMIAAERKNSKRLLVECAAQHPLKPDGTPDEEFKMRLDRAVGIYEEYRQMGWEVSIYVPGSLHRKKNSRGVYVADPIPLCESGRNYLLDRGVRPEDVLAQDANDRYKGKDGVYCSADECYVSSRLFLDGDYQRFMVVCSPAQAMRKILYYILFSTLPIVYTEAPQAHDIPTFHDYVYEVIGSIPNIISSMNDMQGEDCIEAIEMRKDRNPDYSSDQA